MSLVETKRQANFKDFKRYRAFKGLVEQKNIKEPNLHTNSLNNICTVGCKKNATIRIKLTHFYNVFVV
jgi:hypothetical protein